MDTAHRVRKAAAWISLLAAAGCGAGAKAVEDGAGEDTAPALCEEIAIDPFSFWNEEIRGRIRAAHGNGEGEAAGELVILGELAISRIDELVATLDHAAREACEARRQGDVDDESLAAIARCLEGVEQDIAKSLPMARRGEKTASTRLVLALAVGPARRLEGCTAAALAGGSSPESAEELLDRGRAAAARGEIGEGLAFLERADALYAEAGDGLGREMVALEMGHVAAAAGMEDAAMQMYSKAARHCRKAADESPARREAALEALTRVIRVLEETLGPDHPRARALAEHLEQCAAGGD